MRIGAFCGEGMADVFISYKSERRNAAQHLSRILELNGYSVWFDYGLLSGADFGRQIEREIRASKAVIVLWCSLSIDSTWVLEEATLAQRLGTLTPVWLQRVDLPLGFGRAETLDLTAWDGAPRSHLLDRLLTEVARRVGRDPAQQFRGLVAYEESWRSFGAPSLASFALSPPVAAREEERLPTIRAATDNSRVEAAREAELKAAVEKEKERLAEEQRQVALKAAAEKEKERVAEERREREKAKEEEEKRKRGEEEKRRRQEAEAKPRAEEEAKRKNAGGSSAQTGKVAFTQIVGAALVVFGLILGFLQYTSRLDFIYPDTLCFGEYGTWEGCVGYFLRLIIPFITLISIGGGSSLFKAGKNR